MGKWDMMHERRTQIVNHFGHTYFVATCSAEHGVQDIGRS